MYQTERPISVPELGPLFADFVLDLLPHEGVLRRNSSMPFVFADKADDQALTPPLEKSFAVNLALSLLRQTQLQGEEIYYKKLIAFLENKEMPGINRIFLKWVASQLANWRLPTENQVEKHVAPIRSDEEGEMWLLHATPRYTAALHLYGRIVHRRYGKRLHLAHLEKQLGRQFVFEQCSKYAEHMCSLILNLAVLWMTSDAGEELPEYAMAPNERVVYCERSLINLKRFLEIQSAPLLSRDGPRWLVSF